MTHLDDDSTYKPDSKWPLVVGTIAIIYGSIGVLFMCIAFAGVFLGPWLQASLAGMDPVPMPTLIFLSQVILLFFLVVIGIVLVYGGIHTLKRHARGPRAINIWVVSRLVLLVVGFISLMVTLQANVDYQIATQDAVRELMRSNGNTQEQIDTYVPEQDPAMMKSLMVTWSLIASGMFAVCPIVMGFVLSMKKIKAEWQQWD